MQRVEHRIVIGADPSEVFAYISDLDRIAEWQTGVTEARRTSDGAMRVGATAQVTREIMGQRIEAPLTVTEFAPPNRLAVESEVSGVRALATLQVEPSGAESELTFAMEIRGSMLTSFMEPMIAGAAGGDIKASLERLRERFAQLR